MEDFLPILIGIIWIAYTLYSKGQKKKNLRPRTAESQQEERPASLLEQILMGEQIKPPQPYNDYFRTEAQAVEEFQERAAPQKLTPRPFLNEELVNYREEGQSVSKNYSNLGKTIEEILRENEEDFEEHEFDLKMAVIYSEVLNAPYIDYK